MTASSKMIGTLVSAVALATVCFTGAAQAADSNDRIIPPNPADVAILRGLLALQHPSLRQGATAASVPAAIAPTVQTEPARQSSQQS